MQNTLKNTILLVISSGGSITLGLCFSFFGSLLKTEAEVPFAAGRQIQTQIQQRICGKIDQLSLICQSIAS